MVEALKVILSRPRSVMTLMIVMVGAGIASYISIPKEANPDIDVPVFYVSVTQQGVSPEDSERLLVKPLETQLRGLDGLKEITAIASEGHAGIVLEFNIDFDKDQALADVREKVDRAKAEMPLDADEPQVFETNFSLVPTIIVGLSGHLPERALYKMARELKTEIEGINTVLEAELQGHREELLDVTIDSQKLESYAITQQELLNSLSRNNQLVPAGFFDNDQGRFNLKVPGLIEEAHDVFSLPIKVDGDRVVTLRDLANIKRTFKDPVVYTRINGAPAIAIQVTKRLGTNIIENNNQVRAIVDAYTKEWPATVEVNYLLDQSSFIYEVLGSLQSSIITAILLVMIVVLMALGFRSSLLVGIAIPTSFLIGFLTLSLTGLTVNMMVMFGLVLTVGLLVDGAIVVIEYADRKLSEGLQPEEAYVRAAQLMFWPIVSSTATTLVAFMPMLLWPGVPGEFMSYLPIMVIIVLVAALLTALIYLPVMGIISVRIVRFLARHAILIYSALIGVIIGTAFSGFITQIIGFPISMMLGIFLIGALVTGLTYPLLKRSIRPIPDDHFLKNHNDNSHQFSGSSSLNVDAIKGFTGFYIRFLKQVTSKLWAALATIGVIVAFGIATVIVFGQFSKGVEFFVDEEADVAIVMISARGNLSATQAHELVLEVEKEVLALDGIASIITTSYPVGTGSGGGGGGPETVQDKPTDLIGEIQMEMEDFCCRRKAADIFHDLQEKTKNIAGLRIEVREVEGGPPVGKDIKLEIRGTHYNDVLTTTRQVRDFFENDLASVTDIEDDTPLPGIEWQIEIDRTEAGRYGAAIASVGPMVQLVTNGILIGKYRPDDSEDEVDIRVRLPQNERSLDQLDTLKLQTENGLVPLSNFTTRKAQPSVSSITRKDALYVMTVKANAQSGTLPDDIVSNAENWLTQQDFPDTLSFRFRGADEEQKESGAFLMKAMMGSLFLMFIILVTQFNSFYQASLTLFTVILAVIGVLIGMLITGQTFSIIMSGTGIIALAGIVVNNAIVLIDTFNRFRSDGLEILEATLKTSAQRIRPILLTTTTTIAGLIPMATQINFDFFNRVTQVGSITSIWWVQLSTAIISGLAFSTFLTLIFIPIMLNLPRLMREQKEDIRNRFQLIFNKKHMPQENKEIFDADIRQAAE